MESYKFGMRPDEYMEMRYFETNENNETNETFRLFRYYRLFHALSHTSGKVWRDIVGENIGGTCQGGCGQ